MLDETTASAVGTPPERTTHWSIARIENGKPKKLDYPNSIGVRVTEWPLEELTIANVRERWGAGTFKCSWMINDPSAEEPGDKRRPNGHGPPFSLDPEAVREVRAPYAQPIPAAPPPAGDGMASAFEFATRLMDMADRRAQTQFQGLVELAGLRQSTAQPASAPSSEIAEMRAELARMRAEAEARTAREEAERRHREQIARLERERDEARREAEEEPEEPAIVAPEGAGFIGQIGAGIASAIVEAAKKNPELVMNVIGAAAAPMIAKMVAAQQPSEAPATGVPAPAQVAAPVVTHAPAAEPATAAWPSVPMAPAPAPSAAPASVEVIGKTKGNIPVTSHTNGAQAPKPAPAVIDVAGHEATS